MLKLLLLLFILLSSCCPSPKNVGDYIIIHQECRNICANYSAEFIKYNEKNNSCICSLCNTNSCKIREEKITRCLFR